MPGGKQGKRGSGRDPNAGRKISKNQINTSGRRSVAAGKKKRYDVICEKEFRASELNTRQKQQYLLEKKEYCESKLVEKRLARQAALEMDEAFANIQSDEEEGGGRRDGESSDSDGDEHEKNLTVTEEVVDEDVSRQLASATLSEGNGGAEEEHSAQVFLFAGSAVAATAGDVEHEGDGSDGGGMCGQEDDLPATDTRVGGDDATVDESCIQAAQQELSAREVRLFIKDYFGNSFPGRVVSHVTNHDGVHIYRNKLAMTKSKRREVTVQEVEANERLLAQLPYLSDTASYQFYFVQ